ncbi:hypothetical protein FHW36_10453 [Chitinophaga polysaccharea]|uniref:Uncharacterized protein n=1 Tax=Chitinophaga polysaccharea TaxID=1293035 RepID=A0A561PQN2_9BACT|nr:DUF5703 domain-containing protein [Chitinophaga polysaccharea]TWF40371.1 hypothetical protein FHW36_10453 [Chitinophaga polysaccharea]
MFKKIFLAHLFFSLLVPDLFAQKKTLNDYNVVWRSPGINSLGSMPIGNGDIGANVWVEDNGDLVFYVSKTDAWDDLGRLLKLGKVRVSITPNPLSKGFFSQELKLRDGEILVSYGDTKIKCWIDANHPVIQVDIKSKNLVNVRVTYENWRKERRPLLGREGWGVWGIGAKQVSEDCEKIVYEEADSLLLGNNDRIVSFHRNVNSIWNHNIQVQGLSDFERKSNDPLLYRNFGLMIKAPGLNNMSDTVLTSKKAANVFQIGIFPLTQAGSVAEWKQTLFARAKAIEAVPLIKRELAHNVWWEHFWNRSYIFVTAKDSVTRRKAETVTQGYILQRFMTACSGRGNSPIKFNGSIFTVDTYNRTGDYKGLNADFRLWGGCYWWQNTRLPYWSLLEAGDFDLMRPLFSMYMKALPIRKEATMKYYGHAGAFFPETMNFWGTYADGDYGCNRDSLKDGYAKNPYIRYYWQSGLELSLMMLDYYSFTKNNQFAKDTLVPFVSEILSFYDKHWKRGKDGKILFDPAMSLETFHSAVNPLPEIVGITTVAGKMLGLPEQFTGKEKKEEWAKLVSELPALPIRMVGRDTLLAPAQVYSNKANVENPEMYAVFPYRMFTVGKPGVELARRTYGAKTHKENGGWQQNSIQAAYLGLAEESGKMIAESFSRWDNDFRFPAFWGPNYDWTPDQDHGCVAMIALQRMLLQYDNEDVQLLPAWPKEWDVRFKLSGPGKSVFEGTVDNGNLKWGKKIRK